MQSGSDKVLALMKRRYNRDMALANIELLRKYIPRVQFTTDLMVGFPGETEEDFLDTVDLVRRARFIDAHVFAYSKRSGTPAALYEDQVDESEKKSRSRRLMKVKNEVRDAVLDEIVEKGEPLSVILETYSDGEYTAHSEAFIEVKLEAECGLQGEMRSVMPISHKDGIVTAKLI